MSMHILSCYFFFFFFDFRVHLSLPVFSYLLFFSSTCTLQTVLEELEQQLEMYLRFKEVIQEVILEEKEDIDLE